MTYARARLWLGISSVGLIVILALAALLLNWPHLVFAGFAPTFYSDALGLTWIIALYSALHMPLDYIGGYWLPCHFSRQCLMFPFFASQYIRGFLLQSLFLIGSGLLVLQAGRFGGRWAVMVILALVMLLMVEAQDWIARLVGGLRVTSSEWIAGRRVVMISGMDSGFSGGLAGLPGRERIIFPALWQKVLPKPLLGLETERRSATIKTGCRLRGLCLAMAWNLSGFYLSSILPGAGVATLAELFRTALGFTIWSFTGLLLLPTLSRYAVYEMDQVARSSGMAEEEFALLVRELDQLQDDEPKRPPGVEAIFHPIPNVELRLERFRNGWSGKGAWNAARYALYLSWPCLGFLNRAVHCNAGRPELWVMLPVD